MQVEIKTKKKCEACGHESDKWVPFELIGHIVVGGVSILKRENGKTFGVNVSSIYMGPSGRYRIESW